MKGIAKIVCWTFGLASLAIAALSADAAVVDFENFAACEEHLDSPLLFPDVANSGSPLITVIAAESHAEIQMTRASGSGEMIRFDGKGQQTIDATVKGKCRITGGVPFKLPARANIETDGFEAQIRYALDGPIPGASLQCQLAGGVRAMSLWKP